MMTFAIFGVQDLKGIQLKMKTLYNIIGTTISMGYIDSAVTSTYHFEFACLGVAVCSGSLAEAFDILLVSSFFHAPYKIFKNIF